VRAEQRVRRHWGSRIGQIGRLGGVRWRGPRSRRISYCDVYRGRGDHSRRDRPTGWRIQSKSPASHSASRISRLQGGPSASLESQMLGPLIYNVSIPGIWGWLRKGGWRWFIVFDKVYSQTIAGQGADRHRRQMRRGQTRGGR
jgi:hypothetical protein